MDIGKVRGVGEDVLQASLGAIPSPKEHLGKEACDVEWEEGCVGFSLFSSLKKQGRA